MKLCKDCKHYEYHQGMLVPTCQHPKAQFVDPVQGGILYYWASSMRDHAACGLVALLFEPRILADSAPGSHEHLINQGIKT